MKKLILSLAAATMTVSVPVMAIPSAHAAAPGDSGAHKNDKRYKKHKRAKSYRKGYRDGRRESLRDAQYVRNDTRVWRDKRDGRYYCRRDNGTTGLLIGAAAGGLVGNQVAGRGDKLLGTIIGAAGGGLLGRELDRDKFRCR